MVTGAGGGGAAGNPPITVLMAVHDTPTPLLDAAVASILGQTVEDFEFLILDDGSTQELTRTALACWGQRDARIRLLEEPHRGLTGTLNRGLSLARGQWIARQDADDWSEPGRLKRQREFFEAHPCAVLCGTAAWTHQQDGKPLWPVQFPATHGEILTSFWQGNPFYHGSAMFQAAAARAIGGYREEFPCSQDYDFFWRLAEKGETANLPGPLYHYRYSGGGVSARRAREQAQAHRAARTLAQARRRGESEDIGGALSEAGKSAEAEMVLRSELKQADHRLLAGDYRGASWAYAQAVWTNPRHPLAWGKLLRCGVFASLPPVRKACFR